MQEMKEGSQKVAEKVKRIKIKEKKRKMYGKKLLYLTDS
jgi:hypothetical protein